MDLQEQIAADQKEALKSGEKTRLSVLRMVRSKILEKLVEVRATRGRDYRLTDEEVTAVIASYARQRSQSIQSYQEAGRQDLADQEQAELEVLSHYLPEPVSEQELLELTRQAISEVGATSPADMGRVMKVLMPRIQNRADGKAVSRLVQQELRSSSQPAG